MTCVNAGIPITRYGASMSTQPSSITTSYGHDHERLDQLFAAYREQKRVDFARAKPNFREFKNGLYRHIQWEEEILFPLFEEKTGMRGMGPTQVMRIEHRQIIDLLEAIHDKVRQQDPESDSEERELIEVLGAHNHKEENILYPAIDQHVNDGEREEVFERMQEVPEPACGCGCAHDHAPARNVDVRSLIPPQRHPVIFQSFHSLQPGEAFVLINDHDPKPLYYQFAAEYKGQFTWEYLEQGPETWRVSIGKTA